MNAATTAIRPQFPLTDAVFSTMVSREGCVQCNATARVYKKYRVNLLIDKDDTSEDHALALSLGYQQAPVVLVRDSGSGKLLQHWAGFQPERIDALIEHTASIEMGD